jgi:hypothetical protein
MVTKLDRAVTRYLVVLNMPVPARHDEAAWTVRLDRLDRLRYRALDLLIRRQRYKGLKSRKAWLAKSNLHRPPLA